MKKFCILQSSSICFILILTIVSFQVLQTKEKSHSETNSNIGIIAGYVLNFHENICTTCNKQYTNEKNIFQGGGLYAGFIYELKDYETFDSSSSLIFKLFYEDKSATTNEKEIIYSGLINENGELKLLQFPYYQQAEYSISYLTFDLFYRKDFFPSMPLGIVFGATINFPLIYEEYEAFKIKSKNPEDRFPVNPLYRVDNNGKTAVLKDGKIDDVMPILIGLHLHLQYDFKIGKDYLLVPEFGYSYPLVKFNKSREWIITSVYAGFSLRYILNNRQ